MAGHVFLVRGDLRQIVCDAWLMPCDARRVLRGIQRRGGAAEPFGTAVVLRRRPLVEELWGDELRWVGMGENDGPEPTEGGPAARRLEMFLDHLLAQTRDTAHLLDRRYVALLDDDECALGSALMDFIGRLPATARQTPAWWRVERLLAELGFVDADESPAGP